MTSEERDLLYALKNQYWLDFSALVNATLEKAPGHLRDYLKDMLRESSSVYGRKTGK
jgi:hypothetical protein